MLKWVKEHLFLFVSLLVLTVLTFTYIYHGIKSAWDYQSLGVIGDYYGGLANAAALILLSFGLYLQQREYSQSLKEFASQTRSHEEDNELEHFKILKDATEKTISRLFLEKYPEYRGDDALKYFYNSYVNSQSAGNEINIKKINHRLSSYLMALTELLRFISSVNLPERRRRYFVVAMAEHKQRITLIKNFSDDYYKTDPIFSAQLKGAMKFFNQEHSFAVQYLKETMATHESE